MRTLHIKVLGGFAVTLNGELVTQFRSAKARALLAYLAMQPEQLHARATLATLLWGEQDERAALTNLRIELSNLKKVLQNHPALVITRTAVSFQLTDGTIDALQFQQRVNSFLARPSETQATELPLLSTALEQYQGEFLAGFYLEQCQAFEEWRLLRQEELHELAVQASSVLQQHYAAQANWSALARVARRQLELTPWHENAHRNLIQALVAQGRREAALRQYDRCVTLLRTELGVEPTPAMQELGLRLRSHGRRATAQAARHNLPQQQKPLVGRKAEVHQIHHLVQQERLVTLLGLGGVGKSRLALAVAQRALPDFVDGVWFVSLVNIPVSAGTPNHLALAIAAAIGFPLVEAQAPLAELTAHLADKAMLLVLDNWDEITEAAEEFCANLLKHDGVHIIATSRVRLMVKDEVLVRLQGLPPEEGSDLFVERARRINPTFGRDEEPIDDKMMAEIRQICATVSGLPLGIELAASWVEHFSVAEIRQSLRMVSAAPTVADEHVQRHRTLYRVFEYSWRLLSPPQQQLLARLTTFRGGFDRAAVLAVADGNLSDLSLLIAHSLVQRLSAGRYDLHPLVQAFAESKLPATEHTALDQRHSRHYLTLLCTTEESRQLYRDFENMRSAWQRSVLLGRVDLLEPALNPFGAFMARIGYLPDVYQLFADAVARFEPEVTATERTHAEFVAQLLNQQWRCSRAIHGLPRAEQYLHRLLAFTQDPDLLLRTYLELATKYAEVAAWEQAEHYFDLVEALAQQSSDPQFHVLAVESPIHIRTLHFRGDYREHIERLTALLAWLDALPDDVFASQQSRIELRRRVLGSLGIAATRYGDYGLAISIAHQTLAMFDPNDRHPERGWTLLDLALAEQFAGFYAEAIAHNQEALAMAEESGATDDIGLLKANLCLTMRQGGDLLAGLRYGQTGVEALRAVGLTRMEGQARNRVGHTLLALERWEEAALAYQAALAVWEPLHHPNRYEAVAGRAVALCALGRAADALALVDEVLSFIDEAGLDGIVEPLLLLLNCERVFTACGKVAQAEGVLQQAQAWVQTIAGRISDGEVREAFLARPDNRRLAQRLGEQH